jgi:DNA-binding PadR family transcriptional regulator
MHRNNTQEIDMARHFGWDGVAFRFGPRGFAFRGPFRGRRRQWFESGDMKYVILKLLKDKPRHGYEVMKELEDQMQGCYSPSPGTVYPTLQWLEDEGLVRSRDVDGKKIYEITDAGLKFLEEHKDTVEDIFERLRDALDQALGGSMADLNQALGRLVKTVYRTGWKTREDEVRKKVADVLRRAAEEVEAVAH